MLSSIFLTMVVLPAPEGAVMMMIFFSI
jgi:hypothetical protein